MIEPDRPSTTLDEMRVVGKIQHMHFRPAIEQLGAQSLGLCPGPGMRHHHFCGKRRNHTVALLGEFCGGAPMLC